LAAVRALFDPAPGSVYLDAATYGLPPRPTVEIMQQALAAWQDGSANWVDDWDRLGEACREGFARLIGAASASVALVPSVSVGVGTIASGLQAGETVLIADDEFTSVVYPLLVAQLRGVRVRQVPFGELASQVDGSTRLVAFSLVQSQSGRVAALDDILAAASSVGAQTLIDATHAVPFVGVQTPSGEIDPRIDYLVCAAYKHLLAPRGVGFLYVAPRALERVPPILANWRSASDPYGDHYAGELDVARGAARFDVSLAWLPYVGASVSLGLVVDWQQQGVLDPVLELARRLSDGLGLAPTGSTLVSVPVDDAEVATRHLEEAGVRAAVRAGRVRLSPHVYSTASDVDRAVTAIAPFVRQPVGR
jgi:selenocysteine lyase/cysteine desulfurase